MPDFEPINKDEHSTSWSWLGSGFVEGNSWQYTWMVPHDMNELVKMIGREEFNRRLMKDLKFLLNTVSLLRVIGSVRLM